jgi:hypothetical protein
MTPDKLQELYHYAWDAFYGENGYQLKMAELFRKVIRREMEDGTFRRYNVKKRRSFKKHGARP